ncbi:MAG TPA: hypothetical protein VIS96_06525 [Terrimicrobiaceae bacterium]
MLLLSFALMCFHATAHRVIRFWRIFYPVSRYNFVGAIVFSLGLVAMFWSIAVLLWLRGFPGMAVFVGISAVLLVVFGFSFRSMHGRADYMVEVDDVERSERETPAA